MTLIDCHFHLLAPSEFPYRAGVAYAPPEHEQSTADQLVATFDAHDVGYGLVVGPNSGYDTDSAPVFDLIERYPGRFKAVIVPPADVTGDWLDEVGERGVVGLTYQLQLLGTDHLHERARELALLAERGMFADVQVEHDQLVQVADLLLDSGVSVLIDHCGRPDPTAGVGQPGFAALLSLSDTGRCTVKLSGMVKCSRTQTFPYQDAWPFVSALVDAYGSNLVWGSDWPFLRAPQRIDYGPLVRLLERLVPDDATRSAICWDTPRRLFGFGGGVGSYEA